MVKCARHGWIGRFGNRLSGLSLVHGADAAAAAVALVETSSATGAYFVDDGDPESETASAATAAPEDGIARSHPWGYALDELHAALERVLRRRIRTLAVPLGVLRGAARLVGTRRATRSPLLNPDRLADLATDGWVCSGARLRRDTAFRPRFDLVRGLQDTVDFYRGARWLT
jgi:nucleoside-diphosphate-sugar epimerase